MKAEQLKDELEEFTRHFVEESIEVSDPKPLILLQGSGLMVDLTDPSEAGKPEQPGEYKILRSAVALLDECGVSFAATILFNDPARPEVEAAMSLLSSLRFERSAANGLAPPLKK